jgi:hypothetical protein
MDKDTLEFLKDQAIGLLQVLFGAITPNYRMIWISKSGSLLTINVILEQNIEDDLEEIRELEADFEELQLSPIDFVVNVRIDSGELLTPDLSNSLPIYRRKEYWD